MNTRQRNVEHVLTVADVEPVAADAVLDQVVVRPDGYYWVADGGRQEFGPYTSAARALAVAREAAEAAAEEQKRLRDAAAEIGVDERLDRDVVEIDEVPPRERGTP